MPNRSRYPGTRPFMEEDRHLFFGRDHDTKKLGNLIVLEKLVVLFGKSGYGKSSLLNAGVIPYLRHTKHHFPIKIRFMPPDVGTDGPVAKPLDILKDHLVSQIGIIKRDLERQNGDSCFLTEKMDIPKQMPDDLTAILWYYIKFIQITKEINEATTLVFYQFEELFRYYDDAEVDRFGLTMAALLHPDPPADVLGLIRRNLNSFTDQELDRLYEPLNLKVVFSVASDHLSLLNKLKSSLPQIFKYSYELKALSELQAQKALEEPARKDGNFSSPKFTYTDEAIKEILRYLKGRNKEGIELENQDIETFQLQLIGQHAEEKIVAKKRKTDSNAQLKAKPGKQKETREAAKFEYSLKDLGNPSNILKKFYQKVIDDLDFRKRKKVKNLIENGLIVKGNRVALSASQIKQRYSVYEDTLGQLEDEHLLRSEFKLKEGKSIQSFEISHFNLVKPIQDSVERRKQKRLWILIFLLLFLLLITGFLGLWAYLRDPTVKDTEPIDSIEPINTTTESVITEEEEVSNGLIINAIATSTVFPTTGRAPLEVEFIFSRVDTIGEVRIVNFNWDFGDGTTSVKNDPALFHTYEIPGEYTARLTVLTNDSLGHPIRTEEVKIKVDSTISVSPIVKVNLSASPDSGEPLKLRFKGSLSPDSTFAGTYFWDFNDGSSSEERNPTHIFEKEGTYDVSLTIRDINGIEHRGSSNIKVGKDPPDLEPTEINKKPIAKIRWRFTGQEPLKVAFDGGGSTDDVAIKRHLWDFGDGQTSSEISPLHIFDSIRDYNVQLTVWDDVGLKDSVREKIIPPSSDESPIANIKTKVISNDSMPLTVEFDGTGSTDDGTIVSYDWNFGDGHVSNDPIILHTFEAEGAYDVKLTVMDDINQSDDTLTTIKVTSPRPVPPCGGSMTWMERFICIQDHKLPSKRNRKDGWKNWRIPPDSLNLVGIVVPDSLNVSKSIKDLQVALLFFFAKEVLNQERKIYKFQIWLNANQSHTMLQTQRFNINNRIKQSDAISQAQSDAINEAKIDSAFEYKNTIRKYIGPGDRITKYKENTKKVLARLFEEKTIKKEGDIVKHKRISTYYTLFDLSDFDNARQEEIKAFLKELEPEEEKE